MLYFWRALQIITNVLNLAQEGIWYRVFLYSTNRQPMIQWAILLVIFPYQYRETFLEPKDIIWKMQLNWFMFFLNLLAIGLSLISKFGCLLDRDCKLPILIFPFVQQKLAVSPRIKMHDREDRFWPWYQH